MFISKRRIGIAAAIEDIHQWKGAGESMNSIIPQCRISDLEFIGCFIAQPGIQFCYDDIEIIVDGITAAKKWHGILPGRSAIGRVHRSAVACLNFPGRCQVIVFNGKGIILVDCPINLDGDFLTLGFVAVTLVCPRIIIVCVFEGNQTSAFSVSAFALETVTPFGACEASEAINDVPGSVLLSCSPLTKKNNLLGMIGPANTESGQIIGNPGVVR